MNTIDDIRTANLKHLVDGWGGTTKFAERIGKSGSQVSQWLNRSLNSITQRPRVVSTASCREIEQTLGLPSGWMDQSNPELSLFEDSTIASMGRAQGAHLRKLGLAPEQFTPVRIVKFGVSPGTSDFTIEDDDGIEKTLTLNQTWLDAKHFAQEALFGVKVRGEGMEPSLYDGDTIVINTADTEPADGSIFLVNYEGEVVIKRLVRDAGEWWLTSDNSDQRRFHRKIWHSENCPIVGRVVRRETDHL